jgi:hypothetical protein
MIRHALPKQARRMQGTQAQAVPGGSVFIDPRPKNHDGVSVLRVILLAVAIEESNEQPEWHEHHTAHNRDQQNGFSVGLLAARSFA